MNTVCVIPARYASQRLPGKPLADLCGKPLIQHVWERACQAKKLSAVIVATDDERIADAVEKFGGEVAMTSPDCPSGTDRVGEAIAGRQEEFIINVQGDEPLMNPGAIDLLVEELSTDPDSQMATLARPIPYDEAGDPNLVKVVRDKNGNGIYFSRSRIPFRRDAERDEGADLHCLHHLGIYGYRREVLFRFLQLPVGQLEQIEKLEQLRALENGIRIKVIVGDWPCHGVDTPEDLKRVERLILNVAQ